MRFKLTYVVRFLKRFVQHAAHALLPAVVLMTLAACGGGGDAQLAASRTTSTASVADIASLDAASLDTLLMTAADGQSPSSDDAPKNDVSSARASAMAEPVPPPSCSTMYLATLAVRCMVYKDEPVGTFQGVNAASIMPPTPYCQEIPVGQLVYSVTPVGGSLSCYQFPVSASTTVNFEVALPAGIVGTAELHRVHTNATGYPLARSKSPANPLAATTTTQYTRLVLVLRVANGPGGHNASQLSLA